MKAERLEARLRSLLKRDPHAIPLGEAALLLAEAEYPGLDVGACLATLDAHAVAVRSAIAAREAGNRAAIQILCATLFRDGGFRGNHGDYHDPRNSYLNEVLERRLGIPITLSIVYCEVGRRAGLRPEPVGFPGHFLVKHELPPEGGASADPLAHSRELHGETIVVDPFGGGKILTRADLERLLESRFGLEVAYGPQLLRSAEPREVLARVLRNLKAIYLRRGDTGRAFRTTDQILLFEPGAREDRRDRGLLAARLGHLDRAICDLVGYARELPDSAERRKLRAEIDALRIKRAARN